MASPIDTGRSESDQLLLNAVPLRPVKLDEIIDNITRSAPPCFTPDRAAIQRRLTTLALNGYITVSGHEWLLYERNPLP